MSKREYMHQEAIENSGSNKIAIHYAKKCEDLEAENKQQAEQIKELEGEIAKRPAKPLFGEERSLLLKAMDNSAYVDDAIEKYKKLKKRIIELQAQITAYKNCSKDHQEKCPDVKCWVQVLRDEQMDEIDKLKDQIQKLTEGQKAKTIAGS